MSSDTYFGPMARKESLPFLKSQIDEAKSKGAKVLFQGDVSSFNPNGNFFAPTVMTSVDHSMGLMREESFGPVIGIMPVQGDEEAMKLMADTEYGLTAGVYTKDTDVALNILRAMDVGTGYVNCCDRVSPSLPWSGRGGSGVGSTLGMEGIKAFLTPKALHIRSQ